MADKLKAKDKVDHPEAQFDKPKEVVQDKTLSRHEQKKALNTWEQDERQLLTASNEGMPGREEGLQSDDIAHMARHWSALRAKRAKVV